MTGGEQSDVRVTGAGVVAAVLVTWATLAVALAGALAVLGEFRW